MSLIHTRRVTVRDDRLSFLVCLDPQAPAKTTPAIARCAMETYPELASHACVNDVGSTFGAVIANTSTPHLLEHLIITEQVRAADPDDTTAYLGTTRWVEREERLARIDVSYRDDLAALEAYGRAKDFLESVLAVYQSETQTR